MKPYYEDDSVMIFHGDCLELLPFIAIEADVLATDPPYGIRYSPSQNSGKAWGNKTFVGDTVVAGDDAPFDPTPFLGFPAVVLFGANHYADKLPPSPSWLVWDQARRDDEQRLRGLRAGLDEPPRRCASVPPPVERRDARE